MPASSPDSDPGQIIAFSVPFAWHAGHIMGDTMRPSDEATKPAGDQPPSIAVVIPSRNRRELLLRAIRSVLDQDFSDFELIVVDDASEDGSPDAVEAIADARIRVIRQAAPRGANPARNRGLLAATAPIIAFLDSDDEFEPHKLSTVLAIFNGQRDLGTLVDSYRIINPGKRGGRPEDLINHVIPTSEAFLSALFDSTVKERRLRKATSGMTLRREVALRAGLFNEEVRRRQDMEFLIRLAKTARCATTDQCLWIKHEQAQSISFTGDGFIAATLLMGRSHPIYAGKRAYQAADVVMYLWETIKRRRFRQLGRDLSLLASELGSLQAATLIGQGLWAWQVDARFETALRKQRLSDRPKA
jgi:glycosyltransferase involved in cell wall biosynthesis